MKVPVLEIKLLLPLTLSALKIVEIFSERHDETFLRVEVRFVTLRHGNLVIRRYKVFNEKLEVWAAAVWRDPIASSWPFPNAVIFDEAWKVGSNETSEEFSIGYGV